mmetsp:Transcript_32113/g.78249  ORF Transcript_32113/g.78249 Transcript_32113/m.78249 type:complete len:975 (+) Transcript_32113:292-3216(+)
MVADDKRETSLLGTGGLYSIASAVYVVGFLHVLYRACIEAYNIRLYAIKEYGPIIHEFDPYFNYRATEYLYEHGSKKFFSWFDYMVWYPLGRPVGTTIYPGMQFTAVYIKMFILPSWSINDICCWIPAWFGVLATLSTAGLAYVCVSSVATTTSTKSLLFDIPIVDYVTTKVLLPIKRLIERYLIKLTGSNWGVATQNNPPALESAVFTSLIMAIIPAHLLRSVGGGYDNESVATTAMELTFWTWTWTLSTTNLATTTVMGAITGFMYFYMVAAWGGYVFVINLVGLHALFVFLLRKLPFQNLYTAYTSFYIVGTLLAMQVPVVGWTPIKSLEQMGPLGVFLGFQGLQLMRILERKYSHVNKWRIRGGVVLGAIIASLPVIYYLYSAGFFGPISSRVRGLFVQHTKTGNPLVDSVAEHQAASAQAYFQYLHLVCYLAPIGFAIVALVACTPSSSFLIVYSVAAYFFSLKMVRLILLAAPIASVCGGIALGYVWAWCIGGIFGEARPSIESLLLDDIDIVPANGGKVQAEPVEKTPKKKKMPGKKKAPKEEPVEMSKSGDPLWVRLIRVGVGLFLLRESLPLAESFKVMCHQIAQQISHPTIITKGTNRNTGETVIVDDYREAYFWLRDNTPEDARIMAWWDYGYQITGIGNRTTIADGNTWNHEHIALLGRILTGPEKDAHRIARHLADYVLVWAGGGGDDLAKSPHLKRIANSVYRGLCSEPTCRDFTMSRGRDGGIVPSKQLGDSLLYKLHSNGYVPGVNADPNRFRPVFQSKYGKVRIYKIMSVSEESKQWVLDNRECDAPGSWFCPGKYPPALQKVLAEKKDFAQLEDFNRGSADDEYQKQYFENLNKKGGHVPDRSDPASAGGGPQKKSFKKLSKVTIDSINEDWEDNEKTSMMWEVIKDANIYEFVELLQDQPELAHIRSEDGRGPMFWAHEYGRPKMADILKQLGVSEDRTDKDGVKPTDISHPKMN